ncbi:MAG TPA: hypothetical protein VJQ77_05970 [Novosphingobium sp.]|nr:hypothetical protein [Novosphingobium sp.]
MTCERLRQWVRFAQPNARTVYGYGANASACCRHDVRELVQELAAKGYLTPHFTRIGPERAAVQIVQRTARPVLNGAVL